MMENIKTIEEPNGNPLNSDLFFWIADNFPFAMERNPNLEYSQSDYETAINLFEDYAISVPSEDEANFYKAMACLLVSIRETREDILNRQTTSPEQWMDHIPKQFRYVIDDPAPAARKLKKIIFGQDTQDAEKDKQCETAKSVNTFLTAKTSLKIESREDVILKILQKTFPETKFELKHIREMIKGGREILFDYLDSELIKHKILTAIADNDKVKQSIRNRVYNESVSPDDLMQDTLLSLFEAAPNRIIDLDARSQLIFYVIGIVRKKLSKPAKSTVEFDESLEGVGTLVDSNEINQIDSRIKEKLTVDELLMLNTYLESKNYSEAVRKLDNRFSRYYFEQAFEKALLIALS